MSTKEVRKSHTLRGWQWELFAASFGTLAFLGLVILLFQCNGRADFRWHGVTVNTLVALLSALSRASLLVALVGSISQIKWIWFSKGPRRLYDVARIDMASHDAWGRLVLLCKAPLSLASLGALAALMTLAFDPMTQQLVQLRSVLDFSDSESAKIPFAKKYAAGAYIFPIGKPHAGSCPYDGGQGDVAYPVVHADFDMQSAVLAGLTSESVQKMTEQMPVTCTSGNCSWDPFDTLSICSVCKDISSHLFKTSGENSQWTQFRVDYTPSTEGSYNSTAYNLPNGLWLENPDGWMWNGQYNDTISRESFTGIELEQYYPPGVSFFASQGTGRASQTLTFKDADTLIWAMSMIRMKPPSAYATGRLPLSIWPDSPVEALECGLSYCAKRVQSSVVNGVLFEHEQSPINTSRDPASWTPVRYYNVTAEQRFSLEYDECLSTVERNDLRLGNGFNVTQAAVYSLGNLINQTLAMKQITDYTNRSRGMNGYFSLAIQQQWGPPVVKTLFEADNLTTTFASLARSMTNSLRVNSDGKAEANGRTGNVVITVQVDWPWIAFPGAVLALTLLQLVISVVATKLTGAPVFKTSSLALLSQGRHTVGLLQEYTTMDELDRTSKQTVADLLPHRRTHKVGCRKAQVDRTWRDQDSA